MTVFVLRLSLTVPWVGLQCVIVVYSLFFFFFFGGGSEQNVFNNNTSIISVGTSNTTSEDKSDACSHLRSKFDFLNVHGIMSTPGLLQRK